MTVFYLTYCVRYEREFNKGLRPLLRQITAHDVPASCPMVLCISAVYWPEARMGTDSLPELEVTDGWYRLRALIDQPLARALRKGKLRQGQKIIVVGASVCLLCCLQVGCSYRFSFQSVKILQKSLRHTILSSSF